MPSMIRPYEGRGGQSAHQQEDHSRSLSESSAFAVNLGQYSQSGAHSAAAIARPDLVNFWPSQQHSPDWRVRQARIFADGLPDLIFEGQITRWIQSSTRRRNVRFRRRLESEGSLRRECFWNTEAPL